MMEFCTFQCPGPCSHLRRPVIVPSLGTLRSGPNAVHGLPYPQSSEVLVLLIWLVDTGKPMCHISQFLGRVLIAHHELSLRRSLCLHAAISVNTDAALTFLKVVEFQCYQKGSWTKVRARSTETSCDLLDYTPPSLDWLMATFRQLITKGSDRGFTRGLPACPTNGSCKHLTTHINSPRRRPENPVFAMSSNPPSHVAHCPHCLCALDTRQRYSVQVCLPIHPSYAFQVPTNAIARSSPSSVPHDHVNTPAPPYEPPSYSRHTGGQDRATQGGCHHPPTRSSSSYPQLAGGGQDHAAHSQSNHVSTPSPSNNPRPAGDRRERNPLSTPSSNDLQPVGGRRDDVTRGESRRSSSSSPSTVYSEFTDYTINTDIAAGLQAAEDMLLPQLHSELNSSPRPRPPASSPPPGSSPPPRSSPPRSSPPLMSSPPAESLTLPTSSPPPQSQLTLPLSGRQPPTLKRWVVFHGHAPGIYSSVQVSMYHLLVFQY